MKYGEHLKANIAPEYGPDPYLAYERLDHIIAELTQTKPSRCVLKILVTCHVTIES
jgi:SPX domain protein involved in polyphosphate accumulation